MEQDRAIQVVDYWKNSFSSPLWREWKNTHEDLRIPEEVDLGP
jgi:hypothetical protein